MAPKKRPGKDRPGLPKGLIGWVDLSPPAKKERSIFRLRSRTMRGRHNRTEVLNRAQHMKNEIIAAEEKLREQLQAKKPVVSGLASGMRVTKEPRKILSGAIPVQGRDPLTEYGVIEK